MRKLALLLLLLPAGMLANTKFLAITQPTSNGTQTIDIGFAPKLVFFYGLDMTINTTLANARFGFGLADGTTQAAGSGGIADYVGTATLTAHANRKIDTTKCIQIIQETTTDGGNPTVLATASCSFSGNNLVLDWTTTDASARRIYGWAVGGASVNGKVVMFSAGGSASQTWDTLGFLPTAGGYIYTTPTGQSANMVDAFGAFTSGGQFCSQANGGGDVASVHAREQRIDNTVCIVSSAAYSQANLGSAVPDTLGAVLSFGTPGSAFNTPWWGVNGLQALAGNFAQPTSGGAQTTSVTTSFRPGIIMVASRGDAATTAISNNGRYKAVGITDGTNKIAMWYGSHRNYGGTTPVVAAMSEDDTIVLKAGTVTGQNASVSLATLIDTITPTATGFDVHWAATSGTAVQVVYLALEGAAAPSIVRKRKVIR